MSVSNISSITQVQFQSGHRSHKASVCLSQEQQEECDIQALSFPSSLQLLPPRLLHPHAHPSYSKRLKIATSLFSLLSRWSGWGRKFQATKLEAFGSCSFCQSEEDPLTLQVVLVPRT